MYVRGLSTQVPGRPGPAVSAKHITGHHQRRVITFGGEFGGTRAPRNTRGEKALAKPFWKLSHRPPRRRLSCPRAAGRPQELFGLVQWLTESHLLDGFLTTCSE